MSFVLEIARNCKSVFEKRHYDVTFVCQSLFFPFFLELELKNFNQNQDDHYQYRIF